jgi:hypothetical protein
MAEYLIYYKNHWFDEISIEQQNELNIEGKFDSRYSFGDIVEIQRNGLWLTQENQIYRGWNLNVFRVIKINDQSKLDALQYQKQWKRKIVASLENRDDENGLYDYLISIALTSLSDLEHFTNKDLFVKLPDKITILEKQATFVRLRLTLPSEWSLSKKTEIRQEFQKGGKMQIKEFNKIIKKSQYSIDVNNLPQSYQDLLLNQGWLDGTSAQLENYIINKKD